MAHYSESGEIKYPQLIAGTEITPLTTGVTIPAGQGELKAGAVLGRIDGTDNYVLVDSGQSDGSEKPLLVLSHDVDAIGDEVVATCYKCGVFNRDTLSFGGSDTADTHEDALRLLNIHMRQDY